MAFSGEPHLYSAADHVELRLVWYVQEQLSLRISIHLGVAVLITCANFRVEISALKEEPPAGYLFLCPPEDFSTGQNSCRWPDCPAFWSLDPSGAERPSAEEAVRLGFPTIQLTKAIYGKSWDGTVYTGLRQFHKAKGFDPDSQEVARHLGHALFQISTDMDETFTHGE